MHLEEEDHGRILWFALWSEAVLADAVGHGDWGWVLLLIVRLQAAVPVSSGRVQVGGKRRILLLDLGNVVDIVLARELGASLLDLDGGVRSQIRKDNKLDGSHENNNSDRWR